MNKTMSGRIRVYCYCVCKNEADVIAETLGEAAAWAEKIFVWDNGSTDGTIEQIEAACSRHGNIVFMGVDTRNFSKSIRAELLTQVKHCSRPGDWWCKLDSDEIYFSDPRQALLNAGRGVTTVLSVLINFQFTDLEYARYECDPDGFLRIPAKEKFDYYSVGKLEKRFFRDSRLKRLMRKIGINYEVQSNIVIPVGHYRYRSPGQIKTRVDTRRKAIEKADITNFPHEMSDEQYRRYCLREGNPANRVKYRISTDPILDSRIVDHRGFKKWSDAGPSDLTYRTASYYRPKPDSVPVELWLARLGAEKILKRLKR